jgi:hypothetical protein
MEVKKSFSFRFKFRVDNTDTTATHAPVAGTDDEITCKPVADRYRQRLAAFIGVLVAGIGFAFLSIFLPEPLDKWVGIPGVACIFAGLALFFTLPGLRCPACGKAADSGFARFCPACGHAPLRISPLTGTHCSACDRTMGSYKYRNYPVRYCTHCGTLLHRHGI